ncbi:MAG: hypothetical protein MJD61_03155 [Proteobacteria bacterium]|nr:hypothetical protein [Pseudomonadota bacterium]
MSRERFIEFIREAIIGLPHSLKAMLRIVEDPDVPDDGRVAAAGVLLHWLSSANVIPGARGVLQYVDDVLVMNLVLEQLQQTAPDAMSAHRRFSPELFVGLEDRLSASRSYLGEAVFVLEKAAASAHKLKLKGHTARSCALHDEGSTWLYDEIQSALVDFDVEEDEVVRAVRGIDSIIMPLRQRLSK